MSDPEVPKHEQPSDVNDVVDSANAGLDAAAAAGADVPEARSAEGSDADSTRVEGSSSEAARPADAQAPYVDPDLAAFEEAERDHPGTFATTSAPSDRERTVEPAAVEPVVVEPVSDERSRSDVPSHHVAEESGMADAAYSGRAADAETQIVPSEPLAAQVLPQPIFVQAPEPPRDRGNRGTAAGIGLLATLCFAILYLATALGLGAIAGDVTGANIGTAALAPLTTWGFWVPVVVFFIGFWLLGAIINRGRWGLWVVFGIIVGAFAYAGHLLGQLFEAPFWKLTAAQGTELIGEQLLAPLAIAAFVFGRELTIWFGAWVARIGARKTELNAEAQREYERTLEAGPTLAR